MASFLKHLQEEYNRNVDGKIQTVVCLQVTDVFGAWGRGSAELLWLCLEAPSLPSLLVTVDWWWASNMAKAWCEKGPGEGPGYSLDHMMQFE